MMKQLSLFLFSLLLFSACSKDRQVAVPAYVCVPSIQHTPGDPFVEGSSQHNFEDAWIAVDGQIIGANNLPTTLAAILGEEPNYNVSIYAGVPSDGISTHRIIYPFFDPYEINMELEAGRIDTVYPNFQYNDEVEFFIVEDFENAGVAFGEDRDDFADSYLEKQTDDVFEGDYSGQMRLDTAHWECYVGTSFRLSDLQRPNTATPVFLEMHYKTEEVISVGLIAHYDNGLADEIFIKGGVNPSDGWKKIYFDLTEDIFTLNAARYTLILRAAVSDFEENVSPKVYLDNIKILHF